MEEKLILVSIPLFFVAMGIELAWNTWRGDSKYAFADSLTNLSCGTGQQVLAALALNLVVVTGYSAVYDHLRLFTLPAESIAVWVYAFFAVDLGYWVFHWASHRVNFLWAAHAVHHQSEEYNLSVALRQSWFGTAVEWVFFAPLALFGLPTHVFVVTLTLNTLYQFWIHTRAIGRLGPAEWILNTPSHHRVHHGVNPRYLDRNYAGVFIIWDKLFRTFIREDDEPVYGLVKPLQSFNPLWANLHRFAEMGQMAARTSRLRDKLYVWIAPPEWRPADLGGSAAIPEASRDTQQKYVAPVSRGLAVYLAVNYVLVLVLTTSFLKRQGEMAPIERLAPGILLVSALITTGGLFEKRRWAVPLEALRLAGAIALLVVYLT